MSEPEAEASAVEMAEPEPELAWEPGAEAFNNSAAEEESAMSELGSVDETIMWVSLYSLCIVFILAGDILILVAILKQPHLRRKPANLYLVSLIAARTLIGIFAVPARISGVFSEAFMGSIFCKLCHFSALGSSATSVASTLSIAVVKYRDVTQTQHNLSAWAASIINHSAWGGKVVTQQKPDELKPTYLSIVGLWVCGFIYAIRAPFVYDITVVSKDSDPRPSCTIPAAYKTYNLYFTILDCVCLFVIPVFIIVFCYNRVLASLSASAKSRPKPPHCDSSADKAQTDAIKISKMLIWVMSLFIICNIPPYALKLYSLSSDNKASLPNIVEQSLYLTSYSNSWINVLVYMYFRQDLRLGVRTLLSSCCCCVQVRSVSPVKQIGNSDIDSNTKILQEKRDANQKLPLTREVTDVSMVEMNECITDRTILEDL